MAIEIEMISKEFIKPSSPTPDHLRKLPFSSIDQINHSVSIPFILFYEKSNTIPNREKSHLLKQSLAKALTIFYPLAGRIDNYSYADCNDDGALFIEAKANCQLSDILGNRDQYHIHRHKFIPLQPQQSVHQYGSLFQITYFECGGLAITFAMPHMLGDGLSDFIFLNCWAAVARADTACLNNIPPTGSSSIFPPKYITGSQINQFVFNENMVTKSFVFDALTLSGLRDEYSCNAGEKLSRTQALSAFIFCRMRASVSRVKAGNKKRSAVVSAMNLRPLMANPRISEQSFGNFIWTAEALIDKEDECHEAGKKIKDSFKRVNPETVKKLQSDGLDFVTETFQEILYGELDMYVFSSFCNFPIYKVDFGWGEPEWVTIKGLTHGDNILVYFFDTKHGRGIEAWITMTQEDMAEFEKDSKLLLLTHNAKQKFTSRL